MYVCVTWPGRYFDEIIHVERNEKNDGERSIFLFPLLLLVLVS